jgi:drug/metabolite transporter (DMT)-like permease
MSGIVSGYVYALLAVVVWAGNFVTARALAPLIPPFQLNFWRWLVAFCVLLPFAVRHLRRDWPSLRRNRRYLALMGVLGVTLMNSLIYKAGQTTESLNMALLVPTAPVMILLLSRVLYGEPVTRRRLAGLVLVLAGVAVLVSRGDWQRLSGVSFNIGDFWALGGAACFGLYSLFTRNRPPDISTVSYNAATFGIGLAISLPITAVEALSLPLPQLSPTLIGGILYAALGCSLLAFQWWVAAVDNIGPVRSGIVYYSLPVFAAAESVLLLDECITQSQIAGGLMVIGGILVATLVFPGRKR